MSSNPTISTAPTPLQASNSLADLAARIRAEHEAVSVALKDSVRHAIVAGELLIEAKAQLKHGQWLPWLSEHCTVSERTAQLYMRCAKSKTEIEEQIRNGVADLSLNEAAAMLMLSSDVRKLLEMVKAMEGLEGEELISFCAANNIGVLSGNIFNAPEWTEQDRIEQLVFMLWLAKDAGWYVEGAERHMDYIVTRGTSIADWMKPNPTLDAWRRPITKACFDNWYAFRDANCGRSKDDLIAELGAIAKVQGDMPSPSLRPRRRRRRS